MSRIALFHWHDAEAREGAARLAAAGYTVSRPRLKTGAELKTIAARPPDAFVIDLSRLPSHGREVAAALRERQATRRVPIVFVDGDPEKVARVRALLPDATFTVWGRVRSALRAALGSSPRDPVIPGPMAGYSGTPLPRKLGIKQGSVVALRGAPAGFERTLGALPDGARIVRGARHAAITMLFVRSRADLARRLPGAARALAAGQGLWIVWPKQASGAKTDLRDQFVRESGLALGIVDYKICAIDATWSGLLFAVRRRR